MRSSSKSRVDPPEPRIIARDLRVDYGENGTESRALRGFSGEIRSGITGLVGPNGAGKTTFLRTLVGSLTPTRGFLEIGGETPAAYRARRGIGFLPETPPLPGFLTVEEFLAGLPAAGSPPGDGGQAHSPAFPGEDLLTRRIGSLSMGQRKKVALAAALSGDPDVLLLDEPTNGIDPLGLRELRIILLDLRARGNLLLISSHHLDELLRISDVILFVRDGRNVGTWDRERTPGEPPSPEALFDLHCSGGEGA